MGKPKKLILIRHAESEGNIDKTVYNIKPDYSVQLSNPVGVNQAIEAGETLKNIIGNESVRFYVSPYFRTLETLENILKSFDESQYTWREDFRLIEQFYGLQSTKEKQEEIRKQRDAYGTFFYKFTNGESGLDVSIRLQSFLDSLYRDFEKEHFEENCVLVSHGLTMRLFLFRYTHMSVQEFELIHNPSNTEYYLFELNTDNGKYELKTPLRMYEKVYHNWKYKGNLKSKKHKYIPDNNTEGLYDK